MEDQTVDLRLGAPVAREGFIQNTGIFLVLKQLERAGTDWVQVHFSGVPAFSMLSAYSLERIEAKSIAVSQNGASGRVSTN